MLENNFNELDNDFITIWSKFLLERDFDAIANDLTYLAKRGQVDAFQKCLLSNSRRKCKWINGAVEIIECGEVDKAIIKSYHDIIKNNRLKEFDKYQSLKNGLDENIEEDCVDVEISKELIDEFDPNFDPDKELLYDIEQDLKNSDYITQHIRAVELCYQKYQETKNVLYAQKCLELCFSEPSKHLLMLGKRFKPGKAFIENTRTGLIDLYNKNPNDCVVAFALAKNLTMFSDDKLDELKKSILKQLSERELSKRDKFAELIDETRFIRTQIKKYENKTEIKREISPYTDKIVEIINYSKK